MSVSTKGAGEAADPTRARAEGVLDAVRAASAKARLVGDAASRLAVFGREQATDTEQVKRSIDAMTGSLDEVAVSASSIVRGQQAIAESARNVKVGSVASAESLAQVAASINGAKTDSARAAAAAESTATTLEEMARSIK